MSSCSNTYIDDRFSGIARLYGTDGLHKLQQANVAIVGLGGVGSWAAEALARSGIGYLKLIDLDDLCVTNINRQIHALDSTIGQSKIDVLAQRLKLISPRLNIDCRHAFYTEHSSKDLLDGKIDYLIDAIDARKHKAHLLSACRDLQIPVITCGAAGGRRDATKVRLADLSRVENDALLSLVRRKLRETYAFPSGKDKKPKPFRIEAIYSPESPVFPTCDGNVSSKRDSSQSGRLNCDVGFGAVTHVTAQFGLIAASRVIHHITESTLIPPRPH